MDAFEFASYCTGKLLNGLFELKHIAPPIAGAEEDPPTEIVTNAIHKEYLPVVRAERREDVCVDIPRDGED